MSISTWYKSVIAKFEADVAIGKRWAVYCGAVGKAALHGVWSGLASVAGASVLDYSKFNLTNGLRSELDLLILVGLFSGGLAAYLYVNAHPAPIATVTPAAPAAK